MGAQLEKTSKDLAEIALSHANRQGFAQDKPDREIQRDQTNALIGIGWALVGLLDLLEEVGPGVINNGAVMGKEKGGVDGK